MPRKSPYARIAITLPQADLAAADQLARDQDRRRSWIIAEAIRQYAALGGGRGIATGSTSPSPSKRDAGAIAKARPSAELWDSSAMRTISLGSIAKTSAGEAIHRASHRVQAHGTATRRGGHRGAGRDWWLLAEE
jgi:hypothetical protein